MECAGWSTTALIAAATTGTVGDVSDGTGRSGEPDLQAGDESIGSTEGARLEGPAK